MKKIVASVLAGFVIVGSTFAMSTTAEAKARPHVVGVHPVKAVPCNVAGKKLLCAVEYNPYA